MSVSENLVNDPLLAGALKPPAQPTREVEVLRAWEDHTWDTEFVPIPADTPEYEAEEVAREAAYSACRQTGGALVMVALYYDPGFGEDDEAKATV